MLVNVEEEKIMLKSQRELGNIEIWKIYLTYLMLFIY